MNMPGFLDQYGVSDARREKAVKWIVITAVTLVIGSIAGYFYFRTWPAKSHASGFLELLRAGNYQGAYQKWGCSKPCRDYSMERFLEDWGPKSGFDRAGARVRGGKWCKSAVIVAVGPSTGEPVYLWYERSDTTLGYSPWGWSCPDRIPAPGDAGAPVQ